MNEKIKSCFTPHALTHNLLGIGLGLLIAVWVPSLATVWIGLGVVVVAFVLDAMRKN